MLRLEVRNAAVPIERKPRLDQDQAAHRARSSPRSRSWSSARACTRCARRPAAPTSTSAGRTARPPSSSAATSAPGAATSARSTPASPQPLDRDEPRRVAESVAHDGPALRHRHRRRPRRPRRRGRLAVRRDGRARSTRSTPAPASSCSSPTSTRRPELLAAGVRRRAPRCFAHNLETVPRIFRRIRPGFRYERSLEVITAGARRRAGHQVEPDPRHGRDRATRSARRCSDLHDAGCDLVTITQYLRPSARHHPVERWVKPEEFVELARRGRGDRVRRRAERPARPLVVPGRPALRAGRPGRTRRRPCRR